MVGRSILALGSALPSLSHSAGFGVLYRNCTIGACVFHVQLERTILCIYRGVQSGRAFSTFVWSVPLLLTLYSFFAMDACTQCMTRSVVAKGRR